MKRKRNLPVVTRTRIVIGSWFINRGVSMAQRAIKPYTASIDYEATHRLINRTTVVKYNPGIVRELDLQNEDAFKGELCDLFLTCFTKNHNDPRYPKMQSETWLRRIGVKPSTRTPIGAFRDVLATIYRDILEAARKGTLENTHITENVKYLFARHTAHKYGHDKRGTPKAINAAVEAGLIHKGFTYSDDEGNTVTDVIDSKAESFVDDTQRQMLLQKVYETVTDPKDKASLEIYHACFDNGSTIEREHTRKLRKYQALGLRTPASVRQRMSRIPQKYPELKKLNPYR